MKFKFKLIFFAIGLVGIGILLWKADLPHVNWSTVFSLNSLALLGILCGLWLVIYTIHALCYKVILAEESRKINFFSMFKICAAGFALNNVTPAGLVGGEPYRIMELKRYCSTEKSTSSTLTFSLLYTFGHIMLWITTAIVVAVRMILGKPVILWVAILVLIAGGLLLTLFLIFILFRKNGFAYPVMRFLCKIPLLKKKMIPLVEKNKQSYIEIDDNIREFRNSPVRFIVALSMQFLTRLLEAFEYFLLFWFFAKATGSGMNVTFVDGILVMGIASLVGNILFIIPMQASTREGGMTLALGFMVAEEFINDIGVGIGLLYRIREFIFIVLGIILVLIGKRGKKKFTSQQLEEMGLLEEAAEVRKEEKREARRLKLRKKKANDKE